MADLPTVITKAGLQPQAPASLRLQLVTAVAALNPGYTADLPGSLIEDIASTDVGAMVLMDQARVDLINSLTPLGANEFLLNQLGQIYGVTPGLETNTSAFVVFGGPPGYVIPVGFTLSDGTYQYVIVDGGVITGSGFSAELFVLATTAGSWVVPAFTITQLVTSVPTGITLVVNNPLAGLPGQAEPESQESFRARVLQAGRAPAQGMASYLKTLLGQVPGVQPRLVSVIQIDGGSWEVLCGGGDPYAVAYAIYTALFDINMLVGSTFVITVITNANPGQVSTSLNHGYITGQMVFIQGALGMTAVNGGPYAITVVDEKNFSLDGVDTTGFGVYTGGGSVTPNNRTHIVGLLDYPNTYSVTFVVPPLQTVLIGCVWNTDSPDFVSGAAVNALGTPAIATYVNSVPVGQPINIFNMELAFQEAVSSVLPSEFLSRMVWTVEINGVPTPVTAGTGLVYGDPESYFQTMDTQVTVVQG